MAKADSTAPSMPKIEPKASISWPGPGQTDGGKRAVKLSGAVGDIGLGKRCTVTIEGVIKGFRMDEWGGSLDIQTKTVRIDDVSEASDEEMGKSMTDVVEDLQEHKKK